MKMPGSIRQFNKRVINPLTARIARSSWGPFCIIYHTGRRSGKAYLTPVIAFPTKDGFVIALTYGPEVDWYRNLRAAGGCKILWHKQIYTIKKIEPLEPKNALALLPPIFRTVLGLVSLQDYIKLAGETPRY